MVSSTLSPKYGHGEIQDGDAQIIKLEASERQFTNRGWHHSDYIHIFYSLWFKLPRTLILNLLTSVLKFKPIVYDEHEVNLYFCSPLQPN